MKGIFNLTSPADLLKKLEHDYALMKKDPTDQYAAFNFLVTAEHMLDWLYPGYENKKIREELRNNEVLLQACSHLASGAKHFKVQAKHHKSILTARRTDFFGGAMPQGYFPKGYFPEWLFVEFTDEVAAKLGKTVRVNDLAEQIPKYWRNHFRVECDTQT